MPDAILDKLEATSDKLTAEFGAEAWDGANTAVRQLRADIEALGHHIDAIGEEDDSHDFLVAVHNAATEQHNETIDMLYDLGQYEGWRIGDERPCGCPVEAGAVACERDARKWGPAQPDCGECQFGVPVVWHDRYGCEDPK